MEHTECPLKQLAVLHKQLSKQERHSQFTTIKCLSRIKLTCCWFFFCPAWTDLSLFKADHRVAMLHLMLFFVPQRLQVFSTQKKFLSALLSFLKCSDKAVLPYSRHSADVAWVFKLILSRSGMSAISSWAFLPSQEVLWTKSIYSSILLSCDYHSLPRPRILQKKQWRQNSWLV